MVLRVEVSSVAFAARDAEIISCMFVFLLLCLFFVFQAEDGIRDVAVTGVQTCALPIYSPKSSGVVGSKRNSFIRVSRLFLECIAIISYPE